MHETVRAGRVRRDETKALLLVPPLHHPVDFVCRGRRSGARPLGRFHFHDLGNLTSFHTLSDTDSNGIAFVDDMTGAFKHRSMQKYVRAVFKCDKAKALLGIEPFEAAMQDRRYGDGRCPLLCLAVEARGAETLSLLAAPFRCAARMTNCW